MAKLAEVKTREVEVRTHEAAKTKRKVKKTKGVPTGSGVVAWQDDPMGLDVVQRPVPNVGAVPRFKIRGSVPPPRVYGRGTVEFRYWTAAEALRRCADFWKPIMKVGEWQVGPVLPVGLDQGDDLNAYYDRSQLSFFHHAMPGTVVYSGESPDVVCHELGHACLDTLRPELWDAPFVEAAAFHESFGDMSAICSALQLPKVRTEALEGIVEYEPSPVSRLAEQLGWALRQYAPDSVDPNCLRNACNSFLYVDPNTLPDSAPAAKLSAEPHSFSRVFTGAWYELLSQMVATVSDDPDESDVATVVRDVAVLLCEAVRVAPIQPRYFMQVAAHMIDVDTARFGGRYRDALVTTFVKRGLVPKSAVDALVEVQKRNGRVHGKGGAGGVNGVNGVQGGDHVTSVNGVTNLPPVSRVHTVHLSAKEFGLEYHTLTVDAPLERKSLVMVGAALLHDEQGPTMEVERATHRFVRTLFAHRRVDVAPRERPSTVVEPQIREYLSRTHEVVSSSSGLKLVRRKID